MMPKYIDIENVSLSYDNEEVAARYDGMDSIDTGVLFVLDTLSEMREDIVHCKDCKHWKHFDHLGCTDFVKVCGLANYMVGAAGYCVYVERLDEDEGY